MAKNSQASKLVNLIKSRTLGDLSHLIPGSIAGLKVRIAAEKDAPELLNLIHKSFQHWTDNGVIVSPASQDLATTLDHTLGRAIILKNESQETIASISFDYAQVGFTDESVSFQEGENSSLFFKPLYPNPNMRSGTYFVFKKLVVSPDYSKKHIGTSLIETAFKLASTFRFSGIAIESVREAGWLFSWYEKLGFIPIGWYRYPKSTLDTILLLHPL